MELLYRLAAFALMVSSCQAFWFLRSNRVANAEGDVDQACLDLADQGSCGFYTCFEERLACGQDWYIYKQGLYYCNKMEALKPRFTPEGQRFLEDAQKCMMQALKPFYQRDSLDCHQLSHDAVAAITPCFVDNAFCSVFRENREHFTSIYRFQDLFRAGSAKIIRLITNLGIRCGTEYIRDFSSEAHGNFVDSFNSGIATLVDSLTSNDDDN